MDTSIELKNMKIGKRENRDNVDMVNKVIMVNGYYEYDSEVSDENQEEYDEEEEEIDPFDGISEENYRIEDIYSYVLEDEEEKKSLFKRISTFYTSLLKPLRVIEQENLDKRRKKLEDDFKQDMARKLSNIRLSRAAKEAQLDEIMKNIPTETRATKLARMKKLEEEQKERVREMNRIKHESEVKRNRKTNSTDIQIIKKKIQEKKPTIIKIVRAEPIVEIIPEVKVVKVETEREKFIREKNNEREALIKSVKEIVKKEEVPYVVEIEDSEYEEDDGEKEAMQQAIETAMNIMKKWNLNNNDLYKIAPKPIKCEKPDDNWTLVPTKKVKNANHKLNIVIGAKSYKQESFEKRAEKRAEIESQKKLEEIKKKEESRYTSSDEEETEELSEVEIKRNKAFEKLKESKDKGNSKSKICTSFGTKKSCRHGENCRFAHTVDELSPSECFFGTDCKFLHCPERLCVFIHEQETKIQYCQRVGIKIPKKTISPPQVPIFVKTEVRVSIKKLEKSAWQIPLNIPCETKIEEQPIESKIRLCISVGKGIPCPHGNNCRFSHGESINSENDDESWTETKPKKSDKKSQDKSQDKSEVICRSISTGKPCSYGTKCRFFHPEGTDMNKDVEIRICKSVTNGQPCAYGTKCKFVHPEGVNKVVMCRSVGTGKPCPHGAKCRFAHK